MSENKNYFVHETSVVDDGAKIGEGTKIWYFNHITGSAVIGKNCNIGQNVYIDKNVRIGSKVKIQNNVSVYEAVTIEDEVFLGPSCVFTNVINPRSAIERKHEYKSTLVKRGASIGANATIVCGIEIGRYAFIGAGAVVIRNVPDFALIVGNPGKQSGWMCKCGIKLKIGKNNDAVCEACGEKYKLENGILKEE